VKQYLKSRRGGVFLGVAIFLLVSPFIYFFGQIGYHSVREYSRRIRFESSGWRDEERAGQIKDPIRIRMVNDLISSHRLDHLRRPEVERLLGPKTNTSKFKNHDLVYWLGPERGFISIDSEWLVINFDSEGIVKEYTVVRD
jgi:hypothetical protein